MPKDKTIVDKDIILTPEQIAAVNAITDAATKGNQDTREKILEKLSDYAYNEDKLYQLTRFTPERQEGILKNTIVRDYFQNYYALCKIKFTFREIDQKEPCICREIGLINCSFCDNKGYVVDKVLIKTASKIPFSKDDLKNMLDIYPNLLKRCMKMYIGDSGLGRKEIFDFLKALDSQVQQGLFGKIGNMIGGGGIRT